MKKAYLFIRSAVLWAISGVHFGVVGTLLVLLGVLVDPRNNDRPQRIFFRNILRLAGVRFAVRRATGFDPQRTSLFICNHVNIFDPFVIYSAIPQFVRGFELASHFKIPIYGWMMGHFGNVPVPDEPGRAGLEEMMRHAKAALDDHVSLIAFAEGSRTRDGHVGPFEHGIFRLAQKFGVPIVPMSIVGSYDFYHKGDWMLRPGKITVYLHDTITTDGLDRNDVESLVKQVHEIVSGPIEEHLRTRGTNERSGPSASGRSQK